jgi:hypothetical protein
MFFEHEIDKQWPFSNIFFFKAVYC